MKRTTSFLIIIGLLLTNVVTVFAAYPDPGTAKTNLFVQNTGITDSQIVLAFSDQGTGVPAGEYGPITLIPKGVKSILADRDFPSGIGDGWAGSVEVRATDNLAAIVNMRWDGVANTAGAYKGVDAPAKEAYAPLLAVRDGFNASRLTVQNTENSAASIKIQFYDRTGTWKKTVDASLPGLAQKTFDLTSPQYIPDFSASQGQGSAYITSTTNIAVVAAMHWGPVNDNASDAYSSVSSGDTTLWVPSIFREYVASCGNRDTARCFQKYNITTIQNLGDVATSVRLEFWKYDGTLTHVLTDTINPKAAQAYNTAFRGTLGETLYNPMAAALGDKWRGTIKAVSVGTGGNTAQPLTGVCVYYSRNLGVLDCLLYNAVRDSEGGDGPISFPIVFRRRFGDNNAANQFSTTLMQNLTANSGTVQVQFANSVTGEMVNRTWTLPVNPNAGVNVNLMFGVDFPKEDLTTYLGDTFVGSMFVTPSPGIRIAGVTNMFWDGAGRAAAYTGFPIVSSSP